MALWTSKYTGRTRRSASHLLDILTDVQLSSSLAKINKACDKFENAVKNFENRTKSFYASYPKNVLFALDFYQDYNTYSDIGYKEVLVVLNQLREAILAHQEAQTRQRLHITLQSATRFPSLLESAVSQAHKTIMGLYKREASEVGVQGFGVLKGKVLLRTIFFPMGKGQLSRREKKLIGKVSNLTAERIYALRINRFNHKGFDEVFSHPYFKRALLKSAQLGIQSIADFYSKLKEIITLGVIKTFETNHDFFLAVYGHYLNIELTVIVTLQETSNVGGFVRPIRTVIRAFNPGTAEPELAEVSFQDPNHVEIFVRLSTLMDILSHPPLLERFSWLLVHEWEHWLTLHSKLAGKERWYKLFEEGLAVFSEYVTHPESTVNAFFKPTSKAWLSRILRRQLSLLEIESVTAKGRTVYFVGLFMWIIIYSYKSFGGTAQNYLDETWLISIVSGQNREKALAWLRAFSHISPKLFFKMYIEATRAMNVPSFFNHAAEEELLKL